MKRDYEMNGSIKAENILHNKTHQKVSRDV